MQAALRFGFHLASGSSLKAWQLNYKKYLYPSANSRVKTRAVLGYEKQGRGKMGLIIPSYKTEVSMGKSSSSDLLSSGTTLAWKSGWDNYTVEVTLLCTVVYSWSIKYIADRFVHTCETLSAFIWNICRVSLTGLDSKGSEASWNMGFNPADLHIGLVDLYGPLVLLKSHFS